MGRLSAYCYTACKWPSWLCNPILESVMVTTVNIMIDLFSCEQITWQPCLRHNKDGDIQIHVI